MQGAMLTASDWQTVEHEVAILRRDCAHFPDQRLRFATGSGANLDTNDDIGYHYNWYQ